jgi:hypothetical protein
MPDHAEYIDRHARAEPVAVFAAPGRMDYTALPSEMERLPTTARRGVADRP